MCQIYSGTAPELYQSVSRSVRINGVVTSLRLELRFWQILDEIAAGEGFTTPQFLGKIPRHQVLEEMGEARSAKAPHSRLTRGRGEGEGESDWRSMNVV